jgi:striatin 1/3/4
MADADADGQLSLPKVLHYLQREWGHFEAERAKWAQERAMLQVIRQGEERVTSVLMSRPSFPSLAQARVAFLEGQRQGEANLKRDLMRRIKMLEFALQRERFKHHATPTPPDKEI